MENEIKKLHQIASFLRSGAGLLVMSSIASNFLNFLFNAYLGRTLTFPEFATVTMVSTFAYVLNIFIGALGATTTHSVSFLEGVKRGSGNSFFQKTWMRVFFASLVACLLWIFALPLIQRYFNVSDLIIVAAFAPVIIFGALDQFNKGYLQGKWNFGTIAGIIIFEAVLKLALVAVLVTWVDPKFASLAIPLSIAFAWAASTATVAFMQKRSGEKHLLPASKIPSSALGLPSKFPLSFYAAALMSGIATAAFLSSDIILAKHYLSPDDAGRYAMLSLVGKMIFFFGTLFNTFIVTFVGRAEGEGRSGRKEFNTIFRRTAFLTLSAGAALAFGGSFLVPFLLGSQAISIVTYVPIYALSMALFTLSSTIVLYRLAQKEYLFPCISLAMSLVLWIGISREHGSINDFVQVIFSVNAWYFALVVFFHLAYYFFVYLYRNAKDALMVWKKLPGALIPGPGRMRILIFNWRDTKSVYAGGAEEYVQSLAGRWVKQGHSVTLFTSNDGHLPANGETEGVRIIRRGGFYAVYVLAALYYLAHFRGKFDVIIDSENGIPFFMPLFAKERVFCLIHHIHQEVFRKALPLPLASFACFLERRMMPLVYRHSTFITVSESSKREMRALGITDQEIHVVYPGVDTIALVPGEKSRTPLISYVGRLKEHKSVHVLIGAFAHVLTRIPDARLVIAGGGEELARLIELAEKLGISEYVTFPGKVSEEKKREILQQSWVFVNPSMMEGWGITTIEANACGTPVVAADVPGLRDSVRDGETGMLVPYGRIDDLAEKIIEILTNNNIRDMLSHNAIAWAANFEWDKSSERFIDIISNGRAVVSKSEWETKMQGA